MAKKTTDPLEDQIGSLGNGPLGKLHPGVTGNQELTPEQQESLNKFLKGNSGDRVLEGTPKVADISQGWVPVVLPEERARFYPSDYQFMVKAASVTAIKNWVGIDEEDPRQVNAVLNEILKTSVKVVDGSGNNVGYGKIHSSDRFWFILKVREVTFVQGESIVSFEDECEHCGTNVEFILNPQSLHFDFPDENIVEKHWFSVENCWSIDPEEYGVQGEPMELYFPTLLGDQMIIEWATGQIQAKQKVDEVMIKFLSWHLPNPSRDLKTFNRQVENFIKQYKSWSIEYFSLMEDIIKNIAVSPMETLRTQCPGCGEATTSRVKFPNGISKIFEVTSTKIKKFGSK